MEKNQYYNIRPSARIISTIGEDLIKDMHAAIVELVKNSYDADAKSVKVEFSNFKKDYIKIEISDNGHGMSHDIVVNKWLVPATPDKLHRRISPKGRQMQGRKGIGRYAASILGEELLLTTINKGKKTTVFIDWREIQEQEFLEDVRILVEEEDSNEKEGTKLEIIGTKEKLYAWTERDIDLLLKELQKLKVPKLKSDIKNQPISKKDTKRINDENKDDIDDFAIEVNIKDLPIEKYKNFNEIIEPAPLIEFYDYRLYGEIDSNGVADLTMENKASKGIQDEKINKKIKLEKGKYCGPLTIDIRVFDRDPESIESLIGKGLKNPYNGEMMGKNEVRDLLSRNCGIGIYRRNFRIRPYGNNDYDWLELDKDRVQNPSLKIGHNQVIGFIDIEVEEISNLEEKSARDGLKESKYYEGLKEMIKKSLIELEKRRFVFRKKTGRGRKTVKLEKELNNLFDFNNMTNKIETLLSKENIKEENVNRIKEIIQKTENEKVQLLEKIKETIAVYQGQATLGKIVMIILHEGRKPLQWFKDQPTKFDFWINELRKNYDESTLDKLLDRLNTSKKEADELFKLFKRIDPLSVKRRGKRKNINLKRVVERVYGVFEEELKRKNISFRFNCPEGNLIYGWEQDFYTSLTNLVENSIYWLSQEEKENKEILIILTSNEERTMIDIIDNGPGIAKEYIEDQSIFEPGFTTKYEGTGLGLAIAGEAVERNKGKLKAYYSETGAYFRIEINKKEGEKYDPEDKTSDNRR